MMQHSCPSCREPIPVAALNMTEGAAFCQPCGRLWRLAELLDHEPEDDAPPGEPPLGCEVITRGVEMVVRATLRSTATAGMALLFALFWNGIVSIFVLVALMMWWQQIFGSVPAWFPTIEMEEGGDSLGDAVFLTLFLFPFILVGTGAALVALLFLFGRVEVKLDGERGSVRTGVGPLGWTRRFQQRAVRAVRTGKTSYQVNNQHRAVICIEADEDLKFGSMLSEARRNWMRAVLRELLPGGRTEAGRQARKWSGSTSTWGASEAR